MSLVDEGKLSLDDPVSEYLSEFKDEKAVITIRQFLDPELPRARYGIGVWREMIDEASGDLLEASSQGALGFQPVDRHPTKPGGSAVCAKLV